MIKRVTLKFVKDGVFSSGNIYTSLVDYPDGKVIFSKVYARNTPTKEVWEDLKKFGVEWFVDTFHLGSVWKTKPPRIPTGVPEDDLRSQTEHIQKKVFEYPNDYEYGTTKINKVPKWHLSRQGYIDSLKRAGVSMMAGIGLDKVGYVEEESRAIYVLDKLQELKRPIQVYLFIYPDRYPEEIRLILLLEIEFYD